MVVIFYCLCLGTLSRSERLAKQSERRVSLAQQKSDEDRRMLNEQLKRLEEQKRRLFQQQETLEETTEKSSSTETLVHTSKVMFDTPAINETNSAEGRAMESLTPTDNISERTTPDNRLDKSDVVHHYLCYVTKEKL